MRRSVGLWVEGARKQKRGRIGVKAPPSKSESGAPNWEGSSGAKAPFSILFMSGVKTHPLKPRVGHPGPDPQSEGGWASFAVRTRGTRGENQRQRPTLSN